MLQLLQDELVVVSAYSLTFALTHIQSDSADLEDQRAFRSDITVGAVVDVQHLD